MEQKTNLDQGEIMRKLAELKAEVELIKQKEEILEKKIPALTVIEESLAEIWDNEEDEIWNDY